MKEGRIQNTEYRRQKTGTYEDGWAKKTLNIQVGCEHDCRYCYGRANRFKSYTQEQWSKPIINQAKVDKQYRKSQGRIMFPSTHDITQRNINECMIVIRKLLEVGNEVLIVSKPHWTCITLMCETFKQYSDQITFRFTIGSTRNDVLSFWEPGAPNFTERIACLHYAYDTGYVTSVSCEPFLDAWPHYVYEATEKYITDSFWLGTLRKFGQRVNLEGIRPDDQLMYVEPLKVVQTPAMVMHYYNVLKDRPHMKFKDSIRKIIEHEKS